MRFEEVTLQTGRLLAECWRQRNVLFSHFPMVVWRTNQSEIKVAIFDGIQLREPFPNVYLDTTT